LKGPKARRDDLLREVDEVERRLKTVGAPATRGTGFWVVFGAFAPIRCDPARAIAQRLDLEPQLIQDPAIDSRFDRVPFATGCHRLRPLGSINAPSIRRESLMAKGLRASSHLRVEC